MSQAKVTPWRNPKPGELRNLIPGSKLHSLLSRTTLYTILPAPTLGLVSAFKRIPSFQSVSPP